MAVPPERLPVPITVPRLETYHRLIGVCEASIIEPCPKNLDAVGGGVEFRFCSSTPPAPPALWWRVTCSTWEREERGSTPTLGAG